LHSFNDNLDVRLARLEISSEVRQALDDQRPKLAGADVPENLSPITKASLKQAINESFVAGFRRVMMIVVALALLSSMSALLLIEGRVTAN